MRPERNSRRLTTYIEVDANSSNSEMESDGSESDFDGVEQEEMDIEIEDEVQEEAMGAVMHVQKETLPVGTRSSIDIVQVDQFAPRLPVSRKPKQPKKQKVEFHTLHPDLANVWENLKEENIEETYLQQPPDLLVKLLPFQLEGLRWMVSRDCRSTDGETSHSGGILADEMGMGKTIQLIALLLTCPGRTLIICPTVALMQWDQELRTKTSIGKLKVLIYHGSNRETRASALEDCDVVLTTFAVLESSFRREKYGTKCKGELIKKKSLLHSISWKRLVLDEAHAIKDRYSSTAKASFTIKAESKWCITGTPLQNRVGELFSLIRLLNLYPHSYYFCTQCDCKSQTWSFTDRIRCDSCRHTGHQHFCYWNREILKPIQRYGAQGDGILAFKKLESLLSSIMLRRTKVERNDELGLPPRIIECRRDTFNDAEEELYKSLYSDSTRTFNTYAESGTVLNNYASIFSLLSRMRLAANHPVTTKLKPTKSKFVCVVCHEEAEDPIISKCRHVFCREDARQYIQSNPGDTTCPSCVSPLSIDLSQQEMVNEKEVALSIVNQIDLGRWRSSTKIEALVEELCKSKSQDSTIKSLVFSQFVSFLDLVHWRLSRAGFNVVKLDGRMSPVTRAAVIKKFNEDASVTVFLVSLKAGGVGINLTEASRVFIMDPWWNPAVEDQAMDRIHRLGQYRPIKITRMIIENSIESRIVELQEKKKCVFEGCVSGNLEGLTRLSEDDFRFLFVL